MDICIKINGETEKKLEDVIKLGYYEELAAKPIKLVSRFWSNFTIGWNRKTGHFTLKH